MPLCGSLSEVFLLPVLDWLYLFWYENYYLSRIISFETRPKDFLLGYKDLYEESQTSIVSKFSGDRKDGR